MARHAGFREEQRTIGILLGPAVSVNLVLSIAKAQSEVIVSERGSLLQAENGDASATMSQRQIS
jgi:hypothetical protein